MVDLTGTWQANGASNIYQLRQVSDSKGNQNVFWHGKSTDGGPWNNAAFGTINESYTNVGIQWADLPPTTNRAAGELTLEIQDDGQTLQVVGPHPGFGASKFTKQSS